MKITECTQRNPLPKAPQVAPDPGPRDTFEARPWPQESRPEPTRKTEKKPPPAPEGPLTQWTAKAETANQDLQSAREIVARMMALRRLTDAKIAAIMEDTATAIFNLWQEVMARRRKATDDALARWSKMMFE